MNVSPVDQFGRGVVSKCYRVRRDAERQKLSRSTASCVHLIEVSQICVRHDEKVVVVRQRSCQHSILKYTCTHTDQSTCQQPLYQLHTCPQYRGNSMTFQSYSPRNPAVKRFWCNKAPRLQPSFMCIRIIYKRKYVKHRRDFPLGIPQVIYYISFIIYLNWGYV